MTKQESLDIISKLQGYDLNNFEKQVMESFASYLEKKDVLTPKQQNLLNKIAEDYTEQKILERENWEKSFDSKREDFLIIVNYYKAQGNYFRSVVDMVLSDETFVPNERTYNKMMNNKYAKKVLQEHYKEPKYKVGELVYANSKAPLMEYRKMPRGGIILQSDIVPIKSASRGSKQYLVLPVGDSHGMLVEERHLKRRK